ncbi:MAG: hypothetical protein KDA64_14630 [Rhodospirillaceae bacterium]|nr:hypothetical protein [Rhodospirillaceae bacterium]
MGPALAQDLKGGPAGPPDAAGLLAGQQVTGQTIAAVCGEPGTPIGLPCEALLLGLVNGYIAAVEYSDGFVTCLPADLAGPEVAASALEFAREGGWLDELSTGGDMVTAFLYEHGWGGFAADGACQAAAAPQPATLAGATFTEAERAVLAERVAAADPARGAAFTHACSACHTFDYGAANTVGPNLWGVVGRPVATGTGFSYSPALEALRAGGAEWGLAELDTYLQSPRDAAPGTAMTFVGVQDATDRANLLAYLVTLSP